MIAERIRELRKLVGDVALCGVTKGQSPAVVAEAVRAGVHLLGVNYVQEGVALREALAASLSPAELATIEWHFIGHIQSRKAKTLGDYRLVQSLDRVSVAAALDAKLAAENRDVGVLVEVNVGGEEQKSGIAPEALPDFLAALAPCARLRVRGLMAMPPPLEPVEARRPYFRRMRAIYDGLAASHRFDTLSMGTSADFLVAVEEGATMVRLGTTLFGARA